MAIDKQSMTVLDRWSSISEKTVFLLDRSEYLTHVSSGHVIDGDFMKKTGQAGEISIQPFDRSIWTCAVEAVVGYSRLVWDLFTPDQRCISIVAAGLRNGTASHPVVEPNFIEKICSWDKDDQNLDHLLKSLARQSHFHHIQSPRRLMTTNDIANYPNCGPNSEALLSGLERSLDNLSQLTEVQQERANCRDHTSTTATCKNPISSSTSENDNNGRIILISSFQNDDSIQDLIRRFELCLERKNSFVSSSSTSHLSVVSINYCDLVIINTFPINDVGRCSTICSTSIFKPHLHAKVFSVSSGRNISGLLNNLCLQHHNLKSTTITGIPMKEEQSASSSSQYDVEIVHCSSIHEDILNNSNSLLDGVIGQIDRNGFPCDTFKLQWLTPRVSNIDLYHCLAASRITAVDVNSRPSACLTNFLLSGRQVLLEIFKSKTNRMTTHVLASHNGELYIHSLSTAQSKLSVLDTSFINEGLGGKVGDYRVNDFINLIKQNTLCKPAMKIDDPLAKSINFIKRQTLYWPLVLGHTILLNVPNLVGNLLAKIPKEPMTQADVEECKKSIDNLIKCEKDGQPLPSTTIVDVIKSSGSSAKASSESSRLNQLYKLLWNELEYFLRVHSTTPEHECVLDYLLDRRGLDKNHERGTKRSPSKSLTPPSPTKKAKTTSQLLPEISDSSVIDPSKQQTAIFYKTGLSLYQTWSHLYRLHYQSKGSLQFVGRSNPKATLYQHLQQANEQQAT